MWPKMNTRCLSFTHTLTITPLLHPPSFSHSHSPPPTTVTPNRIPSFKWPPLACSTKTIPVRLLNSIVSHAVKLIHGPGHITQPSNASCRRLVNSQTIQAPSIPPLHSRFVLLTRLPYPSPRHCMLHDHSPSLFFYFRVRP